MACGGEGWQARGLRATLIPLSEPKTCPPAERHMKSNLTPRMQHLRDQALKAMERMEPRGSADAWADLGLPRLLEELRIYQEELEIQNGELMLAHTKAEASRAHYQLLFSLLPMPVLLIEGFGVVVEDNDASQDWLGPPKHYQHHDLRLNRALSRQDRPRLNRLLSTLEPLRRGVLTEVVLTAFDQRERRVDVHVARLPADFHQEARFLAVLQDRSVEKARLSEHSVFNALLDSSEDLTLAVDPYGRLMLANQAFLARTGLQRDKAMGRKLDDLLPGVAATLGLTREAFAPMETCVSDAWEDRVRWPGALQPEALTLRRFPIRNKRGDLLGLAVNGRAEDADRSATAGEGLWQALPLAAVATDVQGRIHRANGAFEALTGLSQAALSGHTLMQVLVDRTQAPAQALADVLTRGASASSWRGPLRLRRADGAWVTVSTWVRPSPPPDPGHVWLFDPGPDPAQA